MIDLSAKSTEAAQRSADAADSTRAATWMMVGGVVLQAIAASAIPWWLARSTPPTAPPVVNVAPQVAAPTITVLPSPVTVALPPAAATDVRH